MHEAPDAPIFDFGGKAGTLQRLAPLLTTGRVLPACAVTVAQWQHDPHTVILRCQQALGPQPLIVRSSCRAEDSREHSGAGVYASVLHVEGEQALSSAIDAVIASYGTAERQDEVLIQPMAGSVLISGVAMTRDPETGAPYYVVNYTRGPATDGVTAGQGQVQGYIALVDAPAAEPMELKGLFPMLREIEHLTGTSYLDVEFAITADGPLLFQVRPMTGQSARPARRELDDSLSQTIEHEVAALGAYFAAEAEKPSPRAPLFGLMPDWNPAEMIGTKPRPLAYSLYKKLITDLNWASARFRYGYRDLRGTPLMYQWGGSPYICVGNSLASFIPASVPGIDAERVIATSSALLAARPDLHDRIEFSTVPTCFTPSLIAPGACIPTLDGLDQGGRSRYLDCLRQLTLNILSENGPFYSDLARMPGISADLQRLIAKPHCTDPLHRMRQSLAAADTAAEVFAGAARAGFMATAILKSLAELNVTPVDFLDRLTGGTATIGRELTTDFQCLHRVDFLSRHGHVRPGTYDIRVQRYDEAPDDYFDWQQPAQRPANPLPDLGASKAQLSAIQMAFEHSGLDVPAAHFLQFCGAAITAREKLKYLYAALVSEVLLSITQWGESQGLKPDALSFIPIEDIVGFDSSSCPYFDRARVASHRQRWSNTLMVRTPTLLCHPSDLYGHSVAACRPNFVTRTVSAAKTTHLRPGIAPDELEDSIVLIEQADPGFDWIFTHRIAGFITAYGGENSHMSIRAREFAIPAAIGVGEPRFKTLLTAKRLLLDCAQQHIQVLA